MFGGFTPAFKGGNATLNFLKIIIAFEEVKLYVAALRYFVSKRVELDHVF